MKVIVGTMSISGVVELYNVPKDYDSGVEAYYKNCDWRDERMHIPQLAQKPTIPILELPCVLPGLK